LLYAYAVGGVLVAADRPGLSVWWLKLGIEPRYIAPSSPQDNGRHERMHRTLKAETTRPAAATLAEQQARFDAFRRHYNEERPHEALGQTPPARHWQPSPRALPRRLEDPWYDADHEVRKGLCLSHHTTSKQSSGKSCGAPA